MRKEVGVRRKRWEFAIRLLAFTLILALAAWYVRTSDFGRERLSLEALRDEIEAWRPWHWIAYVAAYIGGTMLLVPAVLISFTGAVLFGWAKGTAITMVAATTAALIAFLVARHVGRGSLHLADVSETGRLRRLDEWIEQRGFLGLIFARLLIIFPFGLINYACGWSSMSTRTFLAATVLGMLPGTILYQYLFANLGESFFREGFSLRMLQNPRVAIPAAIFLVFTVVVAAVGRRWERRAAERGRDVRSAQGR
ncbi:MAG TPA: TVP38/TMEM64 family protein [Planctomycetia bacterium]|nr:TVP38/TMEM64 family protein [Planctomycetia bacterium]